MDDKKERQARVAPASALFGITAAAACAAARTLAASGAATPGAGFEYGAHCQKHDSGQYGQYNDVTHDSVLL